MIILGCEMRVPPFKETPIDIPYTRDPETTVTAWQFAPYYKWMAAWKTINFVSFWGRWDGLSSPGANWTVSFRECRCLKRIIKTTKQMVNHEQPPGCFFTTLILHQSTYQEKKGEKSSTTESPSCFVSTEYVFFWWLRRTFRKNIS